MNSNRPIFSINYKAAGGEFEQLAAIWSNPGSWSVKGNGREILRFIAAATAGRDVQLSIFDNRHERGQGYERGKSFTGGARGNGGRATTTATGNTADPNDPTIEADIGGDQIPF